MLKALKQYFRSTAVRMKAGDFKTILKWVANTPSIIAGYLRNSDHIEVIEQQLKDPEMLKHAQVVMFCWNKFFSVHGSKLVADSIAVKYFKTVNDYHPSNYDSPFMVSYQYIINGVDTELGPFTSIVKILDYAQDITPSQAKLLLAWAADEDQKYLSEGSTLVWSDGTTHSCKGPVKVTEDNLIETEFFRDYNVYFKREEVK